MAAGGQWRAAIEHADIVQAAKAALKDIAAFGVLSIDPPGEIEQQLLKNPLEEFSIAFTASFLFKFVDAPGCPGVHRWIDVAKGPLVCRELAVGMHIPLAGHE